MDQRHLLEEDQQSRALKEFTNLQSMKDLVDWTLFTPLLEEVFGPPRTYQLITLDSVSMF